mgnify:CR=1 FL=1
MNVRSRAPVLLLSALILVSGIFAGIDLSTSTASAGNDSFGYRLINDDSEVEITPRYVYADDVVIPDSIDGKPVTSIGTLAFKGSGMSSITIPDSVTHIGGAAFRSCLQLTSVNIGNGVTTIDIMAFDNCQALSSVTIPGSVTYLGRYAFTYCPSLTAIIFEGDAPSVNGSFVGRGTNPTIYYRDGASGFTTPYWMDLPCQPLLMSMPNAPLDLVAVAGDAQVSLSWSAPASANGSDVDFYTVYVNGVEHGTFTATSAVVTGLVNGGTYEFNVSAHHSFGNGQNTTVTAVPSVQKTTSPPSGLDDGMIFIGVVTAVSVAILAAVLFIRRRSLP